MVVFGKLKNYWVVAQLTEQRALNAKVEGLSPSYPAKFQFAFLVWVWKV